MQTFANQKPMKAAETAGNSRAGSHMLLNAGRQSGTGVYTGFYGSMEKAGEAINKRKGEDIHEEKY